jgi:hypothetical protein
MTNPINNKGQMSRDMYTSGSNFKFLPGGESIPEEVYYVDSNPLTFSGISSDVLVSESEPAVEIIDNPDTYSPEDTGNTDSEKGDFRLPKSFILTFSPESSTKGLYGTLSIDSSGTTTASVNAICSAVPGVKTFEIRVVQK